MPTPSWTTTVFEKVYLGAHNATSCCLIRCECYGWSNVQSISNDIFMESTTVKMACHACACVEIRRHIHMVLMSVCSSIVYCFLRNTRDIVVRTWCTYVQTHMADVCYVCPLFDVRAAPNTSGLDGIHIGWWYLRCVFFDATCEHHWCEACVQV